MKYSFSNSSAFQELRDRAQKLLGDQDIPIPEPERHELLRLTHELEIHSVELELQNEELRRVSRELEHTRNEFADLFDTAPLAFLAIDANGVIEQANQATGRLIGAADSFVVGRYFEDLITPGERAIYRAYLEDKTDHKGHSSCELCLRPSPDQAVYVHLEASPRRSPEIEPGWLIGMVDVSDRKKTEEQLRRTRDELEQRVAERTTELHLRNRQLSRLSAQLTLTEQRERRRLAELMHDHLQQILTGAQLQLEICRSTETRNEPVLNKVHELLHQALETSMNLSAELSPPVLFKKGLVEALRWLSYWMGKTHQLNVEMELDAKVDPLQEELRLLLFQSVRELLFNVVKHTDEKLAWVTMSRESDRIAITVRDQGPGFDPRDVFKINQITSDGFGLLNLRERVQLFGGTINVESWPGLGTLVTLTAPLRTELFDELTSAAPSDRRRHEAFAVSAGEEFSAPPRLKRRVIIVDDHPLVREGMASALSQSEAIEIVATAANGRQAIELADKLKPDVILMDIAMPEMDGITATRVISDRLPQVKIIALSAREATDMAETMLAAGASDYLSKNADLDTILKEVLQTK